MSVCLSVCLCIVCASMHIYVCCACVRVHVSVCVCVRVNVCVYEGTKLYVRNSNGGFVSANCRLQSVCQFYHSCFTMTTRM